jgi:four helix bundle protein
VARIESHRDLIAWQKGMELAAEAYRLGKLMPKDEQYRLTSQLLRAAASVPANLAEGHARGTRKDYAHFVDIARGSLAETETFLMLIIKVGLLDSRATSAALGLCTELSKILTALLQRLREPTPRQPD